MFELKEKVCLVTGASRGIGLSLIKSFLQRGAFCLIVDIDYRVSNIKHLSSKPQIEIR